MARKSIKVSGGTKARHRMVRCSIGFLSEIGYDALKTDMFRIFLKCGENAWSIKLDSLIPIKIKCETSNSVDIRHLPAGEKLFLVREGFSTNMCTTRQHSASYAAGDAFSSSEIIRVVADRIAHCRGPRFGESH